MGSRMNFTLSKSATTLAIVATQTSLGSIRSAHSSRMPATNPCDTTCPRAPNKARLAARLPDTAKYVSQLNSSAEKLKYKTLCNLTNYSKFYSDDTGQEYGQRNICNFYALMFLKGKHKFCS